MSEGYERVYGYVLIHLGGRVVALVPDLPGCAAEGATAEEALHLLEEEAKQWAGDKSGSAMPRSSIPSWVVSVRGQA